MNQHVTDLTLAEQPKALAKGMKGESRGEHALASIAVHFAKTHDLFLTISPD